MDVTFYKCETCGNIAIKVIDDGPELVCCGKPMTKLVAGSTDAATEKHVPAVSVEETHVHVNVGDVAHPMQPEHYINLICCVTDKGYTIHKLSSDVAPETDFYVGPEEHPEKVYEYCNLHGLWCKEL
ncbi:MAG: desulfoferrodoxin [Eggerthellaceae bacterium]|nr:desulfoferrodoxin [Eggerthellaceae bacterium]